MARGSIGSFEDVHDERTGRGCLDELIHAQFLVVVGVQLTHDGRRVHLDLLLVVGSRTCAVDRLNTHTQTHYM